MSDAFSAVKWLLEQDEPEARRVAVQQIVKVRGRQGAELLTRALADDDWRVRKEAAYVASSIEPRDEIVASLISSLGERLNIGLRNAAVEALVAIGADAVPAAIEALSRLDADGRKLAIETLGGVPDVRGTTALTHALHDEDPNVRVSAAEALGNSALAGEDARELAISALADVLAASEMFLKLAALDALSRLDAKLPWKTFEPYASDPVLRRYAIAAAAGSREPAATTMLAKATGDGSPTIAREAVVVLGDCVCAGVYDDAALELARATLRASTKGRVRVRKLAQDTEDPRGRGAALVVTGVIGNEGDIATLIDALADEEMAERAELGLKLYGDVAASPLLEASKSARATLRAAILSLIPSIAGARMPALRETLRDALSDTSIDVLAAAVKALGGIGEAEDLARVIPFVGHEDARLAMAASNAVASLAAVHVEAGRAILQRDALPHPTVGCVILGAIGASSPLTDGDVAFLQRALAHEGSDTRRAAVDALAAIGGATAADLVAFALADEERDVQLAAMRALGQLGRPEPLIGIVSAARDPALVAAALRALGDADPEKAFRAARPLVRNADVAIACAAVEAIGRLSGELRIADAKPEDALFEALEHPDPDVVKVALSELAAEPDARALARLGLCLDHASWEVRRLAAELLGQDGSTGAQALLRARFEREKDPVVREAIAAAVSVRPTPYGPGDQPQSGVTMRPYNPILTRKPGNG